jgi:hypothetical protein
MNIAQKQVGWNFWIWWVGLTIIGGLAGNYIADMLGLGMLSWPTNTGILFSMLGSGVFALSVSTAQWFLLRRLFSKTAWWLVAGTFGRAFGMLIGSMILVIISNQFKLQAGIWSTSIYLTARGAVLGTSQWLILKQWRTKAGWWVLGNAIGWMLGSTLLDLFIPTTAISAPIISDLIEVAIAGAVTGAFMVWILRQPTPAPMKETGGSRLIITWISIWAISWGVSWAVGWSIVRDIIGSGYITESGQIGGRIAGGIAGLIGGVGTAVVLKLAKPSSGLKIYHLILLALGWASIVFYDWLDGFAVAGLSGNQNIYGVEIPALSTHQIQHGMGGSLSGLVGGALTALILLWLVRSLNWKQLCVIGIGWALGFAIGGWIVWTIGFPIALNYVYGPIYGNDPGSSSLILFTLISALCGAFAGWCGGAATLKQLSIKPSQNSENIISTSKDQADEKIDAGDLV